MAQSREDAGTARPLTLQVLGNIDHFRGSTLASMLKCIGGSVSDRGRVAIAWLPRGEARPDEPCINCNADADKHRLADHFVRVFRYPLGVEPTFTGDVVRKSPRNGAHDGQVVRGPIAAPTRDSVYQHLINNHTSDNRVIDLRVPFIGGISPVCWIKCRPIEKRFAPQATWARLASADELFSQDEQALLTRFCDEVHLEYGELDVLRDVQSDSIYVVDVNPTPHPLTTGIEADEWKLAVHAMAVQFREAFLS